MLAVVRVVRIALRRLSPAPVTAQASCTCGTPKRETAFRAKTAGANREGLSGNARRATGLSGNAQRGRAQAGNRGGERVQVRFVSVGCARSVRSSYALRLRGHRRHTCGLYLGASCRRGEGTRTLGRSVPSPTAQSRTYSVALSRRICTHAAQSPSATRAQCNAMQCHAMPCDRRTPASSANTKRDGTGPTRRACSAAN